MTAVLHAQLQSNFPGDNYSARRERAPKSTRGHHSAAEMSVERSEEQELEPQDSGISDHGGAHGVNGTTNQSLDVEMAEEDPSNRSNSDADEDEEGGSEVAEGSTALDANDEARNQGEYGSPTNGADDDDNDDEDEEDGEDEHESQDSVVAEEWEDASAGLRTGTASIAEAATRNNCV